MSYIPVFCWEQNEEYAKRLHGLYGKMRDGRSRWVEMELSTHKRWRRIARDNIPEKRVGCEECVYLYKNFQLALSVNKVLSYYDCVCDGCADEGVCMGKSHRCVFGDCQSARRE